ncbi:MAG TPA: alkaline phosphatase family protein [Tepidisphaeraceae bacterium]|jgi:predicted AlkP superfamily pyrophosphatase or phosphodiesterase|nr:alkaline phosphatase family protein [Tepidisphaeraceae bacterium]
MAMSPTDRVVLFLIDGLRGDALGKVHTPHLDRLIARGASTTAARSLMPNCTLPCHTSIFFGVPPERHGIVTNTFTPFVRPVRGLIETITTAGGACAMFHNWEQLRDLSPPGHLKTSIFHQLPQGDLSAGDRAVAQSATDWLGSNSWNFAFIYLGATDEVGHRHGWMSDEYLVAFAIADQCIGQVLPSLGEQTTVIVTADHGGHARTHGTDCDEDMLIPFIISGPNVPAGATVNTPFDLVDFAPSIVRALGVTPDANWTGQPATYRSADT